MTVSYLPIYKAKLGEFQALSETKKALKAKVLPLFEVCRIGKNVQKAARFKNSKAPICDYLGEVASGIAEVCGGQAALVDAFQWHPDTVTETGEHVLPYIYARLEALDVRVVPVIGYDRWDSKVYRLAMQGLEVPEDRYYCLRLDSHASEDAEDPDYFHDRVAEMLDDLQIEPRRCAILIDFGDVTALSLETLLDRAEAIMQVLEPMGFRRFATAGCSLPPTIDGAVKNQNSSGKVVRKEMLLWQALRTGYPNLSWVFGDYGVRGPSTAEDVISPHTNGKIRHTIDLNYFIVRGHSMKIGLKGAQMHQLAKTIVDSIHYMGPDFSWGDERILACSKGDFKGSSTNWIAIDTNHHLAWVVAEVTEFELTLAGAAA